MGSEQAAFVGAWKLITFEFRKADGGVIYPFGEQAQGSIIYTGSGRYSAQLMRKGRPRFKSSDQMRGTVEEIESNYKGCISYFGTYKINTEKRIIIHHVEGSIFPNMEGSDQKRHFELTGNHLTLKTLPTRLDGEKAIGILQWERIG
jgi:hypothetical protein